jgi:hypothetical protein
LGVCGLQRLLGFHSFGNISKEDRHPPVGLFSNAKGIDIEPSIQRGGFVDETDGPSGQDDCGKCLKPKRFVVGRYFEHAFADGIDACFPFEGGIDLDITVIDGFPVHIKEHFDDAETFVHRVEEMPVPLLALAQLVLHFFQRGYISVACENGFRIGIQNPAAERGHDAAIPRGLRHFPGKNPVAMQLLHDLIGRLGELCLEERLKVFANDLRGGPAIKLFRALVPEADFVIQAADNDCIVAEVEKAGLLGKLFLRLFPVGDIADAALNNFSRALLVKVADKFDLPPVAQLAFQGKVLVADIPFLLQFFKSRTAGVFIFKETDLEEFLAQ